MSYLWEETLSNLRRGGLVNLICFLMITLSAVILSLLMLSVDYIGSELERLKEEPALIAFLDDSLDPSSAQMLRSQIEKLEGVEEVRYVSKEEALRRCKEAFGEEWELIFEGLEGINPLPASFEIALREEALDPESIERLAAKIEGFEGVEEVRRRTESPLLIRRMRAALWGVGSVLGLASIVIVFFSVMLTAHFRREEIRIMRLVGATNWFIRGPLMMQGIVLGLTGSSVGVAIFYAIFKLYAPHIGLVKFLPPWRIAALIAIGGLLGFLGGIAPIRRYIEV